jgi:hypothetical protein
MERVSSYPDFYDPSLRSLNEEKELSFLETLFFKERAYSVRTAQVAQYIFFGGLSGSFCLGSVSLPWVSRSVRVPIGVMMLTGMALSLTGAIGNYLVYHQVFKRHNSDYKFHFVKGPILSGNL